MKTSYFAKYNGNKGVSIALKSPAGFKGETYSALAPTSEMLREYKKGNIDDDEYTNIYYKTILSHLNPNKIYDDLGNKVLLCWEGKEKFCHRHLVAEWIELELGVKVEEL